MNPKQAAIETPWIKVSSENLVTYKGQMLDVFNGRKRLTNFIYMVSLQKLRSTATKIDHDLSKFTHFMPVPDVSLIQRDN